MNEPVVRRIGQEADPALRLRQKWGAEMRYTREKLLGLTLDQLVERLKEVGCDVTPQAVSAWERGDNSPRPHRQIAWCKATGRRHADVFPMTDEAAA